MSILKTIWRDDHNGDPKVIKYTLPAFQTTEPKFGKQLEIWKFDNEGIVNNSNNITLVSLQYI